MLLQRTNKKRSRSRPASLTIELLILLPIIFALIFAMVQFSLMEVAIQRITVASAQGARVGAQGGAPKDVERAVKRSLGNGRLQRAEVISRIGNRTGDPVVVTVRIPSQQAVPNLLAFFGVSFHGKNLVGQTVLRKE